MRRFRIAFLLFAAFVFHQVSAQPSPPPGVRQNGAVTNNHCVKWVGNNLVADTGAACGGGSGTVTSVIAGAGLTGGNITTSGTIAINTGIVAEYTGAITVGHCASWSATGVLQDTGAACGTSSGGITSLSQGTGIVLSPNPIIATGTVAINPAVVPTYTGTTVATHCAQWNSAGVLTDAGAACGAGAGYTGPLGLPGIGRIATTFPLPAFSNWSVLTNGTGYTFSNWTGSNGPISITNNATAADGFLGMQYSDPVLANPNWTVTFLTQIQSQSGNYTMFAAFAGNATQTECGGIWSNAGQFTYFLTWTNFSTYTSFQQKSVPFFGLAPFQWWKIQQVAGTGRTYSYSTDGFNWIAVGTLASPITGVTKVGVGFCDTRDTSTQSVPYTTSLWSYTSSTP